MRKSDEAKADYLAGKTYKEIAAKYNVSPGTVRAWKSRYRWDDDQPQQNATKSAAKKRNVAIEDVEQNSDLNDKQKMFCLYYMQRFNATWAYQKAYGVNWNTAHTNGSRMLANASVQKEIQQLRKLRQQTEAIKADDIIYELQRQAFADIGDYVEAKRVKHRRWMKHYVKHGPYINGSGKHYELLPYIDPETGKQAVYYKNEVTFTGEGDTSLLKTLRLDKGEALVETNDKVKALTELLKRYPVPTVMQSAQIRKANAEAKIAEAKLADFEDDKDDQMDVLTNMMSKLAKNVPKDDQNDD